MTETNATNEVDAQWVTRAVTKLSTPGLLTPNDAETVRRYLVDRVGYSLLNIVDAPVMAATKRAALEAVVTAVGNNQMHLLVLPKPKINATHLIEPAGRINPLDIVPAPVAVETNGHKRGPEAYSVVPNDDSKAAALMLEAFKQLTRTAKPEEVPLDEGKVKVIAEGVIADAMDVVTSNLTKIFDAAIKNLPQGGPARRIEIVHPGGKVIDIGDEPRHWQFEQILTWLSAGVPLWLWGKAGGGKTHLARQLAKALDLPATVVSIDPTMTVGKLVGYRNLATGDYVPGFLLAPYRDGGLLMLDEVDTGDPGIIACLNALLANGHYLFPDGNTVERHANFRVMAGANTKGTGAVAGYTARQRLDAATLNRFAIIELTYDERLEEVLSLGYSEMEAKSWQNSGYSPAAIEDLCKRWVLWVRAARAKVGNSVLISPRASYLGVAAIRGGVAIKEVAEALVFALVSEDTKQSMTHSCGTP